ncbi:DUF5810 domain-containing protein [Halorussus halophilus]|uniref:DUF5810 domain-containing protein n=1 Tax=Halorussus halophilus TaxID=2650975 RepID=UPI001300D43E|nr:DUF5810 domain-containing protein [Halorussus halophilus]
MGYACPVCETPHPDTEHLANHLAFTALLGDEDHEDWLAEHFPEWEQAGERELAERVGEHTKEVEYPQVFDDTTPNHDHRHDDEVRGGDLFDEESQFEQAARRAGGSGSGGVGGTGGAGAGQLDAEAQQILQEAQSMTEEMMEEEGSETNDEDATEDETE